MSNLTFAQPFTLDLGQGSNVLAAAVNSTLSARFTANPADQVLSAEQLLAGLSFVHFENAFLTDTAASWSSRRRGGTRPLPSSTRCWEGCRATRSSAR